MHFAANFVLIFDLAALQPETARFAPFAIAAGF